LIENSAVVCQDAGTFGTSKESDLETPKLTPSTATEGTSTAVGIGDNEADGSRNPAVRVVTVRPGST